MDAISHSQNVSLESKAELPTSHPSTRRPNLLCPHGGKKCVFSFSRLLEGKRTNPDSSTPVSLSRIFPSTGQTKTSAGHTKTQSPDLALSWLKTGPMAGALCTAATKVFSQSLPPAFPEENPPLSPPPRRLLLFGANLSLEPVHRNLLRRRAEAKKPQLSKRFGVCLLCFLDA